MMTSQLSQSMYIKLLNEGVPFPVR
jgi:hypothetical protein